MIQGQGTQAQQLAEVLHRAMPHVMSHDEGSQGRHYWGGYVEAVLLDVARGELGADVAVVMLREKLDEADQAGRREALTTARDALAKLPKGADGIPILNL